MEQTSKHRIQSVNFLASDMGVNHGKPLNMGVFLQSISVAFSSRLIVSITTWDLWDDHFPKLQEKTREWRAGAGTALA